jgi:Ala-tRNA(Pro) deacylase
MALTRLREFLDSKHVRYIVISHSRAFTATETAEAAKVRGKSFAKVTMVKIDGNLAMAVVPAADRVDLELLRGVAGARQVELAHEHDFKDRFPDCEVGAMPPFGNLYGMTVYIEESLARNPRIAFNAGSHTEIVELACSDYQAIVQPTVARLTADYAA